MTSREHGCQVSGVETHRKTQWRTIVTATHPWSAVVSNTNSPAGSSVAHARNRFWQIAKSISSPPFLVARARSALDNAPNT